jgi:hypothetical protein
MPEPTRKPFGPPCPDCGKPVAVGEGINVRARGVVGGWRQLHRACYDTRTERVARVLERFTKRHRTEATHVD